MFRQRGAVAMVVRFIKPDIPSIEDFKLPTVLKDLVMEKLGMILIVGSTGSGKSSSMAAMIDYRNSTRTGHILTIEDPMEFVYKHKKSIVNQREVGMDTKSYDNALVSAMREAPDLLMIGEIRDKPTLQSALLFAQTGHLCLSTLHANNSYHAMNRIINFFPREAREALLADLAISLRCVISQRLVRAKTGGRIPAVEIMLNTSAHLRSDQERRNGRNQGSDGAKPRARQPDFRAGALQSLQQRPDHARRRARQLRLADQPALADQQRGPDPRCATRQADQPLGRIPALPAVRPTI